MALLGTLLAGVEAKAMQVIKAIVVAKAAGNKALAGKIEDAFTKASAVIASVQKSTLKVPGTNKGISPVLADLIKGAEKQAVVRIEGFISGIAKANAAKNPKLADDIKAVTVAFAAVEDVIDTVNSKSSAASAPADAPEAEK